MKKKKVILISVITTLVVTVGVLLAILLWPSKSDKKIYTEAIRDTLSFATKDGDNNVVETLEEVITNKIINVKLNAKVDERSSEFDIYTNEGVIYALLELIVEGDKTNADFVFSDEKLYFNVEDVLDRYYYFDADDLVSNGIDMNSFSEFDFENFKNFNLDIYKVIELLMDSILSSIDDSRMKHEDSNITINSVKYNTDRYSYTYTGEDLYKAVKSFLNGVKEDKELYSQLEELFGSTSGEAISLDEGIDYLLDETKVLKELGELITYTVYMYKGDVISTQISLVFSPVSLIIDNIEDEFFDIYVKMQGKKYFDLTIEQNKKDNYSISLTVQEEELLTGTIQTGDDKFEFDVEINGSEQVSTPVRFSGKFEVLGEYELEGTLEVEVEDEYGDKQQLELGVEISEVDKMPKYDIDGARHYTEMSDSEREALGDLGLEF